MTQRALLPCLRLLLALLTTPLLAAVPSEPAVTGNPAPPVESSRHVWFDKPASLGDKPRVATSPDGTRTELAQYARRFDFLHSLPTGNGRLGAMDCGGVAVQRVILNESSVWSGGPFDPNKHDAHKSLPEIRRLLFAGDFSSATRLLNDNFRWSETTRRFDPRDFGAYQTLGDLIVQFEKQDGPASDYWRSLDVMTGVVTTEYQRGGVTYKRELVIPKTEEVIALRLSANKPGALSLLATLARPAQVKTTPVGATFVMEGQLTFDTPKPLRDGVRYRAVLGASVQGGRVSSTSEGLKITDADSVVLIVSAGTDMFDKNFAATTDTRLKSALGKSFDLMRDAAAVDHGRYMERCQLFLPEGPNAHLPTPERVRQAQRTTDPTLDALYFQFGRHLMVAGSRPDSQLPLNLQGIWAEEIRTPWNGDFHSNINVQMNYWPAEITNLSECHLPLMQLIETTTKTGAVTAKAYYNAPGWLCFHTQNPWGYSAPSNMAAGSGSTCGAWMTQHIWLHYDYTRDVDFLRKNYPALRDSARFFLATLVPEPKHGWLVTAPSNSPENHYRYTDKDGKRTSTSLTYGATYDNQIIRDLFTNTIAAAKVLNVDADLIPQLEAARAKLPPTQLNEAGRIMEWIEDYEEADPRHRHVSHLWGLHPGAEITPATPELFKGARATLERRGDASTGWSMAWKSNFWARLQDGDRSRKLLTMLIGRGAPNLFCLHPPFQIDGNFGGTSAVAEMLLQNPNDELSFLPALPSAWSNGTVRGLTARNNLTVDLVWENNALKNSTVTGKPGIPVTIHYRGKTLQKNIPASGTLLVSARDF